MAPAGGETFSAGSMFALGLTAQPGARRILQHSVTVPVVCICLSSAFSFFQTQVLVLKNPVFVWEELHGLTVIVVVYPKVLSRLPHGLIE